MCGRYVSPDDASIEREFNLPRGEWRFPDHFNVAPSQTVPIVRRREGVLEGALVRWGLVPFFAHGVPGKWSTFNARMEGLKSSASFRGPWRQAQRCLVPARGFYEWHVESAARKRPYYIHLADQEIFAFAGLCERSRREDGTWLESCTLITRPANRLMAEIHNAGQRMPVILPRERRDAWLDAPVATAEGLLQAYPDAQMVAYPVGTRVNSPRHDEPALIDPLVDPPAP